MASVAFIAHEGDKLEAGVERWGAYGSAMLTIRIKNDVGATESVLVYISEEQLTKLSADLAALMTP